MPDARRWERMRGAFNRQQASQEEGFLRKFSPMHADSRKWTGVERITGCNLLVYVAERLNPGCVAPDGTPHDQGNVRLEFIYGIYIQSFGRMILGHRWVLRLLITSAGGFRWMFPGKSTSGFVLHDEDAADVHLGQFIQPCSICVHLLASADICVKSLPLLWCEPQ
jgi:hypothetical protein